MKGLDRTAERPTPQVIPFLAINHLVAAPVLINDSIETKLILDTGIGINLISQRLADQSRCVLSGRSYTGKRMSGQEISVPLSELSSLSLGSMRREKLPVGVFDMENLPSELSSVGGFVSAQFFEDIPFTIDYTKCKISIENESSFSELLKKGRRVPIRVVKDGPCVSLFLDIRLPNDKLISCEVDTGTDSMILDRRFMRDLGISKENKETKIIKGKDETGYEYIRFHSRIQGKISVAGATTISQCNPMVTFQDIIYDGLVGRDFLKSFVVTYDVPGSSMVFA